jgi:hypothetical protein
MEFNNTTKEGIIQSMEICKSCDGNIYLSITNTLEGISTFAFIEIKGWEQSVEFQKTLTDLL